MWVTRPPGFAWPLLPVWKIDDDDDHPGAATVPEGALDLSVSVITSDSSI